MVAKVSGKLAKRYEEAKTVAMESKLWRQLKDLPGFDSFMGPDIAEFLAARDKKSVKSGSSAEASRKKSKG